MKISEAKDMDMVEYLGTLGHHPVRISGKNYWYLSPFRNERTASFKIDRTLNRWYDFGEGGGGNLVDFGIRFHGCSVKDFLQKISSQRITVSKEQIRQNTEPKLIILSVHSISSPALVKYLDERRIIKDVAANYCNEIRYQVNDKIYYALGFINDAGGYELRSPYFKGSSSPKDTTFIDQGAGELAVFEGFFSFLSYQSMYHGQQQRLTDFLVLNSVSFFERSVPLMLSQQSVRLYLDRDTTGQNCTQRALSLGKQFTDESWLYKGYKDLNEWIMHPGQSQKQQQKQQLKPNQ